MRLAILVALGLSWGNAAGETWRYMAERIAATGEPVSIRFVPQTVDVDRHEYEVRHHETGDLELVGALAGGLDAYTFEFAAPRVGHFWVRVRTCREPGEGSELNCSTWTDSRTPENVSLPIDAPAGFAVGWLIHAWIAAPTF